jgi:hypothetical protein
LSTIQMMEIATAVLMEPHSLPVATMIFTKLELDQLQRNQPQLCTMNTNKIMVATTTLS